MYIYIYTSVMFAVILYFQKCFKYREVKLQLSSITLYTLKKNAERTV